MTSVAQKAGSFADRVIAAGEASEKNLKLTGTLVKGALWVPAVVVGTAGGTVGGAIKGVIKGDKFSKTGEPLINNDRTVKAARVLGAATFLVTGAAALAGLGDFTVLGALALGVTASGVAFVGSGVINAAEGAVKGGIDGGAKGFEAGRGAARVAGGGAQVVADETVKIVKNIPHVIGVTAYNAAEGAREGYEHLSVREADAAQAVADALKEKANAVSNGHARYDAKGNKLPDVPAEYKKY